MALFVGGVEFLRLLFLCVQRIKQKRHTTHWRNSECKKEEIYFVWTAEHPV